MSFPYYRKKLYPLLHFPLFPFFCIFLCRSVDTNLFLFHCHVESKRSLVLIRNLLIANLLIAKPIVRYIRIKSKTAWVAKNVEIYTKICGLFNYKFATDQLTLHDVAVSNKIHNVKWCSSACDAIWTPLEHLIALQIFVKSTSRDGISTCVLWTILLQCFPQSWSQEDL